MESVDLIRKRNLFLVSPALSTRFREWLTSQMGTSTPFFEAQYALQQMSE